MTPVRVIDLDIAGVRARACELEGQLVTFDYVGLFESMGITRQSIRRRAEAYEQAGRLGRTETVLPDQRGRPQVHKTVSMEGLLVLLMGASPQHVSEAARPALTALQSGALAVVMDAIRRGDARVCLPLATLLGEPAAALPPAVLAPVVVNGAEYPPGTTMGEVVAFMDAQTRRYAAETLRIREARLAAREDRLAGKAPKGLPKGLTPAPPVAKPKSPVRLVPRGQLPMFVAPDTRGLTPPGEASQLAQAIIDDLGKIPTT